MTAVLMYIIPKLKVNQMIKRYAPQEVDRLIRRIASEAGLKNWRIRRYSTSIELTDDEGLVCDWVLSEGRDDVFEIRESRESWMRDAFHRCKREFYPKAA